MNFFRKYESKTYLELREIAKRRGLAHESIAFRGLESDERMASAREGLVRILQNDDSRNISIYALIASLIAALAAVGSLILS